MDGLIPHLPVVICLTCCKTLSHPADAATEIMGRTQEQLEITRQTQFQLGQLFSGRWHEQAYCFPLCYHQNNLKQCLVIVQRTKQGVYIFLIYSPMQTSRNDPIIHHKTFWGCSGQYALCYRRVYEQVGPTPPGRVLMQLVLLWGRRMGQAMLMS